MRAIEYAPKNEKQLILTKFLVQNKKKNGKICFLILLFLTLFLPIVHAKFGDSPEILVEKTLNNEIRDIDVSSNYIIASAGKEIILFDITGKELWRYAPPATDEIHAVAISPSEDYLAADGRYSGYSAGQIHLIDIDKTLIESIEYEGLPIDYFDLGKPNRDNINFVYKYGEKGYFLAVRRSLNKPVLTYVKDPLNKSTVYLTTLDISNKTFRSYPLPGWRGAAFFAGEDIGQIEIGNILDEDALLGNVSFLDVLFGDLSYLSLISSARSENSYMLTLINNSERKDKIVWQFKQSKKIQNIGFIKNGDKIIASSGDTLFILDNPLIKELPLTKEPSVKPSLVVLANSIDYPLASDFFGFLKSKNKEAIRATASDFAQYKNEKFIVILGGPDAPEGVGDIAREVLSEIEEIFLRQEETRKMFIKTNVWTSGQVVMVIAGNNRYQTQKALVENKDSVSTEISG